MPGGFEGMLPQEKIEKMVHSAGDKKYFNIALAVLDE